jgi:uncharacterized protein YndB with AHSA1/START domain
MSTENPAMSQRHKLVTTLPSELEIVMTRVFDAPRRLVFEAHSKPEHIKQWWGPRGFVVTSCEMDFRPGGAWRIIHRGPDGQDYAFRGEFREIAPPERIVQTFEFEGAPGHISVETLTMVEHAGRTTLTSRSVFDSVEARDAMLNSGMEGGAAEALDRLEEYLPALA